jgi:hypothetical protein
MTEQYFKETYWNLYQEIWNFHKKYRQVQPDDEYWDAVITDSTTIANQYKDNKFAVALILAVVDELERKSREMMNDANAEI